MWNRDLLKISVFIFFDKIYSQRTHCVTIENIFSNKKLMQLSFKNKDLKCKVRRSNLKLILLYHLKQILDELLKILYEGYHLTQLYIRVGFLSPVQALFFLICVGDSMGQGLNFCKCLVRCCGTNYSFNKRSLYIISLNKKIKWLKK